ncbi:hypothetical protein K3217_22980 [bacterium BD-1]|nr:hypothetical protein [Ottowia caeni]
MNVRTAISALWAAGSIILFSVGLSWLASSGGYHGLLLPPAFFASLAVIFLGGRLIGSVFAPRPPTPENHSLLEVELSAFDINPNYIEPALSLKSTRVIERYGDRAILASIDQLKLIVSTFQVIQQSGGETRIKIGRNSERELTHSSSDLSIGTLSLGRR